MKRSLDENGELPKSKSQFKREAQALDDLGKELVRLSEKQLEKMQLIETIKSAILAAKTMQKGAHRRQLQYIGKLLRKANLSPIKAELARIQRKSDLANAYFQKLELHRDRLIQGDEPLFEQILKEHPLADRQQLRQLVRNAQKEQPQDKSIGAAKALFRYLRDTAESLEKDDGQ